MTTAGKISSVLLVLFGLVSVPMAIHDFVMLLANENFGWGVFGVMFIEGPLAFFQFICALMFSTQFTPTPTTRAWAIAAWCLTALSVASVLCVFVFGRASGC